MKSKILIVGGAGYIGSHMVLRLVQAGYDVVVFDNLSHGHRDAVLAGELVVAIWPTGPCWRACSPPTALMR